MKLKIVSIVLSISLIFSALQLPVFAGEAEKAGSTSVHGSITTEVVMPEDNGGEAGMDKNTTATKDVTEGGVNAEGSSPTAEGSNTGGNSPAETGADTEGNSQAAEGSNTEGNSLAGADANTEGNNPTAEGSNSEGNNPAEPGVNTKENSLAQAGANSEGNSPEAEGSNTKENSLAQAGANSEGNSPEAEGSNTEGNSSVEAGANAEGNSPTAEGSNTEGNSPAKAGVNTEGNSPAETGNNTEGNNSPAKDTDAKENMAVQGAGETGANNSALTDKDGAGTKDTSAEQESDSQEADSSAKQQENASLSNNDPETSEEAKEKEAVKETTAKEETDKEEEEEILCSCKVQCSKDKINSDCLLCSAEEAELTACVGKPVMRTVVRNAALMTTSSTAATYYVGTVNGSELGTSTNPYRDLSTALAKAKAGDTIIIQAGAECNDIGYSAPIVINKQLTIEGDGTGNASLSMRGGSIVLGADVTLKNFQLSLPAIEFKGIFANGYTLTMENITGDSSTFGRLDVYAGGLNGSGVASGSHGQVNISGTSEVKVVSGGSREETWSNPSTITISGKTKIETGIIAGGFTDDNNGLNTTIERVDGEVTIRLSDTTRQIIVNGNQMNGATKMPTVILSNTSAGSSYEMLTLSNVGKLSVEQGVFILAALNEAVDISVKSGAVLDLSKAIVYNANYSYQQHANTFTMKNLEGGGTIQVTQDQALRIEGTVTGTTKVHTNTSQGIDYTISGIVVENQVYINTKADVAEGSFAFVPNYAQEDDNLQWVKSVVNDRAQWVLKKAGTTTPVTKESLNNATVAVTGSYTYNGVAQVPQKSSVTVTLAGTNTVVPPEAYTIAASNNTHAGEAAITITAKADSNYTGTATGSFTISPCPITLTADAQTIYYGQTAAQPSYRITSGSLVGNETLNGTLAIDSTGKNITQGTLTNQNNPNYNISFVPAVITVKKTTPVIEVIPNHPVQKAGGEIVVTVKVSNPYNSALQDFAAPVLTYQIGTQAKQTITDGRFTIPAGTARDTVITLEASFAEVADKYAQASGTAHVTVTDKTVVDASLSMSVNNVEYGKSPDVQARFTGTAVGTSVWTYTYSNDHGNTFKELDAIKNNGSLPAGSYQVKVHYEDSSQIGEKITLFEVTPKRLTVELTASGVSKTYDGTTKVEGTKPVLSLKGSVTGETPILNEAAVVYTYEDASAGKDKTIIASTLSLTSAAVNANYTVPATVSGGGAQILAQQVKVTPGANQAKEYGQADPASLSVAPVNSKEGTALVFTGSLTRAAGEGTGTYAYSLGNLSAGKNYQLSLDPGSSEFTIKPAQAELTLSSDVAGQQAGKTVAITVTAKNKSASTLAEGTSQPSAISVTDGEGNNLTMENKGNGVFEGSYTIPAEKKVGETITLTAVTKDSNYKQASGTLILTVSKKEETPSPQPDQGNTKMQVEIKNGISQVPDTLKKALNITTPQELEAIMRTKITQRGGILAGNTAVYDVTLMISTDNGKSWQKATKDNFPKEGIEVTLPYPQGTAKDTHDFTVVHMFSQDMNGKKAGETETPAVTKGDKGISFVVTGLSPISLGWKEINKTPATPQQPSGAGNTQQNQNSSTGSGNTGQNQNSSTGSGNTQQNQNNHTGSGENNSSSSSTSKVEYNEQEFWKNVDRVLRGAKDGDTVKTNAGGYNYMPRYIMETLRERGTVALEIRWNGGNTITIPAGKALNTQTEQYALANLEKTDFYQTQQTTISHQSQTPSTETGKAQRTTATENPVNSGAEANREVAEASREEKQEVADASHEEKQEEKAENSEDSSKDEGKQEESLKEEEAADTADIAEEAVDKDKAAAKEEKGKGVIWLGIGSVLLIGIGLLIIIVQKRSREQEEN